MTRLQVTRLKVTRLMTNLRTRVGKTGKWDHPYVYVTLIRLFILLRLFFPPSFFFSIKGKWDHPYVYVTLIRLLIRLFFSPSFFF